MANIRMDIEIKSVLTPEIIESKVVLLRGQKVILDRDLAMFYGVDTGHLKRQVKRNLERFPDDFMFLLTKNEVKNLRCQIGISSWGGQRYMPYAFTREGIAMLSSVLNSKRAIQANIQIMRVFIRVKEIAPAYKQLVTCLKNLEEDHEGHEEDIQELFILIDQLQAETEKIKHPQKVI